MEFFSSVFFLFLFWDWDWKCASIIIVIIAILNEIVRSSWALPLISVARRISIEQMHLSLLISFLSACLFLSISCSSKFEFSKCNPGLSILFAKFRLEKFQIFIRQSLKNFLKLLSIVFVLIAIWMEVWYLCLKFWYFIIHILIHLVHILPFQEWLRPDDGRSISQNIGSLNTFVHDMIISLYCKHWTDKRKFTHVITHNLTQVQPTTRISSSVCDCRYVERKMPKNSW